MYQVILEVSARRDLKKLDKQAQRKVLDKLEGLRYDPRLGKPLVGNLAGIWSLRIGELRVLYRIFDQRLIVFILKIGNRKDVYDL